jgi:hypothetical protein
LPSIPASSGRGFAALRAAADAESLVGHATERRCVSNGTGCPSYAKDGKVVCFFQSAQRFKARYATFGFSDEANLDEGHVADRLRAEGVSAAEEASIAALVRKAVN